MALMTTSTAALTGQYQKYFDEKLLPHAVNRLVLAQYGQRKPFPKNKGAKVMRFTRGDIAAAANVGSAGEGIATTTFRDYALTFIDATLVQYDLAAKISDVLNWTDLFSTLKNTIAVMGEDVALHADTIIRNAIVAGVTGAGNRRYVGATQTFAGLAALTGGVAGATGALTISDVLKGITRLTLTMAPGIKDLFSTGTSGGFVLVVGPQVGMDIINDPKVVLANQYAKGGALMNGEIGQWYGIRVVVTTNPFIEDGTGSEGTYAVPAAASNAIYRSFLLGGDGFGIPIMGGQSPFNPSVMICDKPDKSDPTNKFITAGMKTYWTAVVLNDQWIVSISSKAVWNG